MNTVVLKILIIEDTPDRQKILKNLYKDHAWILVHTAQRAIKLLSVFKFDLISLDYNLAGSQCGDEIAAVMPASINNNTKILVHSMNKQGADKIKEFLPDADFIPISKMIKTNTVFKKIKTELAKGTDIDWAFVFKKETGQ